MEMTNTPAVTRAARDWRLWLALATVYLVWGSTYLAIRLMVESVPPLLGAGARFGLAGLVVLAALAAREGAAGGVHGRTCAVLRDRTMPTGHRRL